MSNVTHETPTLSFKENKSENNEMMSLALIMLSLKHHEDTHVNLALQVGENMKRVNEEESKCVIHT